MRKSIIIAGTALLCVGTTTHADNFSTDRVDTDYSAMRWVGPYTGTAGGYSWGKARDRELDEPMVFGLNQTTTINGASYGGYVGYNWVAGNIVYGFEANFNGSSMSGLSEMRPVYDAAPTIHTDHEVNWYGTSVGRLGFATGPLLLYVNGGVVLGNEKTFFSVTVEDDVHDSFRSSALHVGWTAGAGFEYALNDVLSTRVEFDHIEYAEKSIADGADNVGVRFETIKFGVTVKMQ